MVLAQFDVILMVQLPDLSYETGPSWQAYIKFLTMLCIEDVYKLQISVQLTLLLLLLLSSFI